MSFFTANVEMFVTIINASIWTCWIKIFDTFPYVVGVFNEISSVMIKFIDFSEKFYLWDDLTKEKRKKEKSNELMFGDLADHRPIEIKKIKNV